MLSVPDRPLALTLNSEDKTVSHDTSEFTATLSSSSDEKDIRLPKFAMTKFDQNKQDTAVLLVHKFSTFFQLAHSLIRNIIRFHFDKNN